MESRIKSSASPSAALINSPSYDFGPNPCGNNWCNQNYQSRWNKSYKGYEAQTLPSQASKAEVPSQKNTKNIVKGVSITGIPAQPKTEGIEHKSILKGADVKPKVIFDDHRTTNSSLDIESIKTTSLELTEITTAESLRTTDVSIEKMEITTEASKTPTALEPCLVAQNGSASRNWHWCLSLELICVL
ncbi:hypothetical protein ACOME3_010370 [Neoechinorhynchus agilis]